MSCRCCDGVRTETPAPVYNRPGLPALSYRTGTHGRFRESMVARLSAKAALDPLTTREPDDPAIALLDCWAMVGDVLTFYQERIANEGYLRTATEPESLNNLGKLVGYTPRPALGSSTYLAYTLIEDARTLIPSGAGAKSVPAQGQVPQTYETSEELLARGEWNALAVRRNQPPDIRAENIGGLVRFSVDGTTANLKGGDRLLFLFGAAPEKRVRQVKEARTDYQAGLTEVTLVTEVSEQEEFAAAREAVIAAIIAARTDILTRNKIAADIDTALFVPVESVLGSEPGPDIVLGSEEFPGAVVRHIQRLPEEEALARPRADCALTEWLDGPFAAVRDAATALVALAVRLARRSMPEVEELRRLAERLICGPPKCPPPPCEDPAKAAGLVGLTPILAALRRKPSRPPRNAAALDGRPGELFLADSDVHPKLLIAADPLLAPNLHRAWSAQEIAPPIPLSGMQVQRLKARVTEIVTESDPPSPDIRVRLDAVYDGILPGSWVVIESAGTAPISTRVLTVSEDRISVTVTTGGVVTEVGTTSVTVISIGSDEVTGGVGSGDVVWAQGETLVPLGDPITADVAKNGIELARTYDGLRPGRWLIVSGERTDVPYTSGVQASELAMVAGVRQRVDPTTPGDSVRTTLLLANDLAYTYRRDTVTVYGNVVAATQGETRDEVLGSGDSAKANQVFTLRQVQPKDPLTWSAADNPLGAENSLTVRVNGVAWHETDGLALAGPTDHAYTPRTGVGGGVSVLFGDGVHGARLPSGRENVTARYRIGAGRSGNVAAGAITQLASSPLGVTAVTNPLPATGGAEGDGPGDARATTPLRMLALDRLVSVRDYADFTRARAGIGKASAAKLFDGKREVVHVTIAGIGDVPIDPLSGLFGSLESSLTRFGDLGVPVRVAVRDLTLIVLSAGVRLLPDYSWDLVVPRVRAALLAEFGFTVRELGEPAYLSQAIAAMQRVEGVDYVDVDVFQGIRGDVTPIQLAKVVDRLAGAATCVPAEPAHYAEEFADVERHAGLRYDSLTLFAARHGLTLDELAALNPDLPDSSLDEITELAVFRGIRPARLAVLPADVPEALTLRRIP